MRSYDLIRRAPNLFVAELTWRWSFALGAAAVLMYLARRLSQALNLAGIYDGGYVQMTAIERARITAQALVSSLPQIGASLLLGSAVIALFWIVTATVGRGVVTRTIVLRVATETGTEVASRYSWFAMAGAHFARVFTLIILLIGYLLAALAEQRILSSDPAYVADPTSMPAPGTLVGVLLAFSVVMGLTVVLWSLVHFVASIAPIFVARDGRGILDALADSVDLVRRCWRTLVSEATRNATQRGLVALAISAGAILVGATLLRRSPLLAWTIIAILTFAYCVLSDWFLLARTIAYVQIAEVDRSSTNIPVLS